MEWRKGNTFATSAFLSYGLFWFSLVTLIVVAKLGWAAPSNDTAMAAYLAMWGLFTGVMFIGTLRLHVAGRVVFGSLTILFFLLAIGDYTNASAGFKRFTGYEGIFCGFSAIYAGLAQVLNEIFVQNCAAARHSEEINFSLGDERGESHETASSS